MLSLPTDLDIQTSLAFTVLGFPSGSVLKNLLANAKDMILTPGWGRSPEEGNGNPLQYSCLKNPTGREARQATVLGAKSQTQLSD